MKDFLIDLFFIIGAVASIGLAILAIIYFYMFMIEFLSHKKWFEHIREKHERLNK